MASFEHVKEGAADYVRWLDCPANHSGQFVKLNSSRDRCIQVLGTPDGATWYFEGTNHDDGKGDDANWKVLTDPQGNALSGTTAGVIEAVMENARWYRFRVSGGGGSTSLSAFLQAGRSIR